MSANGAIAFALYGMIVGLLAGGIAGATILKVVQIYAERKEKGGKP